MKKRIIIILLIITVAISIPLLEKPHTNNQPQSAPFVKSHTPTFFLHGWGGSANSERFMVDHAKSRGVTFNVVTAIVSSEGNVRIEGKFDPKATNPIVKIELEDNEQGYLDKNAKWFKSVLETFQHDYQIKDFNFVGHSMGNLTFAQYMMMYGHESTLPQLKKQVNIAGTYNGVLGMNETENEISVDEAGKPSRMNPPYQELLVLRDIYEGKGIHVLNIYGDLKDGSHSDGRVSNSSSKSLKYLLGNSPKIYKEARYEGKKAQHSQLHENQDVADELIEFLWEK
ncbi:alpha/beta hydrolase [Staphylococcus massiliensis]|uniref:Alpha/beta hydrolase n=1 Tax=Staphylococcus massiliensis S46 TaxID=1229783 RepID=K9B2Y0_9STAP|nr:alpha/beta hydrolase [Staphylococcus massiliensis]EKU48135.1 hypothetical protein C273_05497 [Staphylococcus massiliensis S46]MCG3402113.1 alpha/beta hydrolase [Staphylococcus massiliensis]MCG3413317.1 alpha/beta hydrolase [Staphylococcus massiliensis]